MPSYSSPRGPLDRLELWGGLFRACVEGDISEASPELLERPLLALLPAVAFCFSGRIPRTADSRGERCKLHEPFRHLHRSEKKDFSARPPGSGGWWEAGPEFCLLFSLSESSGALWREACWLEPKCFITVIFLISPLLAMARSSLCSQEFWSMLLGKQFVWSPVSFLPPCSPVGLALCPFSVTGFLLLLF